MSAEQLLTSKGWVKGKKCGTCSGSSKYPYTHPDYPSYTIEVLVARGLWRLKINGKKRGGGHVNHLKHQHFVQ